MVDDLIFINEQQNHFREITIENTRRKVYLGKDTADKIFFCPSFNVVVLDANETNKIGTVLLDYIRVEFENEKRKLELENIHKDYSEEKCQIINE